MNYLPFNLEEALKNPKRAIYRNGDKPDRLIHTPEYNDYAIITFKNGTMLLHLESGRNFESHDCDLLLLPIPVQEYYAIVFINEHGDKELSPMMDEDDLAIALQAEGLIHIKTINFTV